MTELEGIFDEWWKHHGDKTYVTLHTGDPGQATDRPPTWKSLDPSSTEGITWTAAEIESSFEQHVHYIVYWDRPGWRGRMWRYLGRRLNSDRLGRRGTRTMQATPLPPP